MQVRVGRVGPAILELFKSSSATFGESRVANLSFVHQYLSAGLGYHAINVIEGKSELLDRADIMAAYGKYSPGAEWGGANYVNVNTGTGLRNFFLTYQDTYVMGKGYMHVTDVEVPDWCYTISG